jgi:hypothetical protein
VTWADDRRFYFYGQSFFDAATSHKFDCLAGDSAPTIVGGYAKWQVVDRPLQRGLTTFQGYDPMSISLSLRFIRLDDRGGWIKDDPAGMTIEKQIEVLEWMAGESIEAGPSPLVWVSTFNAAGKTAPLIPYEYQATTKNVPRIFGGGDDTPWIVTALAWDTNAIRNEGGLRIRQDATVTLQYYSVPSYTGNAFARTKARRVTSRPGLDTALLIARSLPTPNAPSLATQLLHFPQNAHLHLRSVNQKIKHGRKVYVPSGPV